MLRTPDCDPLTVPHFHASPGKSPYDDLTKADIAKWSAAEVLAYFEAQSHVYKPFESHADEYRDILQGIDGEKRKREGGREGSHSVCGMGGEGSVCVKKSCT